MEDTKCVNMLLEETSVSDVYSVSVFIQ